MNRTRVRVPTFKKAKSINHNDTLVRDAGQIELEVEELEEVIAPVRYPNHNETLVHEAEEVELKVEELEEVIAPIRYPNHSETLVGDTSPTDLPTSWPCGATSFTRS